MKHATERKGRRHRCQLCFQLVEVWELNMTEDGYENVCEDCAEKEKELQRLSDRDF